ncbi:MAG TPA: DUF885 domain-containing protein [Actinophytocola sp.]|uniref:DUF885 domain-containing protein n=1 Tax=Actinophytocola sp. TaxID=1872138 RepID=UPI002DDD252B|nr:DUF885 domain-containing protein [Actinophytocola sp.]HEV2782321.1 DUF885 domain-containing protein [Actinophytocola sp.]
MTANDVNALADELLDAMFTAEPISATLFGIPGHDHRLPDPSEEGDRAHRDRMADIADRAAVIDPSTLDPGTAVTRAVVEQHARATLLELDARLVEYTISGLFISPPGHLITALPMIALPDAERGQAYIARLSAIPDYLTAVAERHRAGVAAGRLPVRRLVDSAVALIDRYLSNPDTDPFLRQQIHGELAAERERVVAERVRPAFAAYRAVLADEIVQHGRADDRPGVCWLPDGEAIYAGLSTVHTTTGRTPENLHQTGLDLIAALAEEYAEIGSRVFGLTDQQEIFRRMTSDPALRWTDGDELLAAAMDTVRRAEEAAPRWFGRLPSQPCKVDAVPAAEAPTAPTAYYMMPAMDGSRPGIYFANTHEADKRDRFLSEVIAFHEAVPGHHFQLSLAQELTHLPLLRRLSPVNAYAEGWGLYTERLADEMGLYSGDLDRLGMLAMDSLRAGRLVVDTGIHAKGWSRQQAVDYLRTNTPVATLEIENEVDRYIAYIGQALSYMVGRLELQRMRTDAKVRLGDRFDIRAFHDVVLGGGSLPLNVLDGVLSAWDGSPPS